MMVIKKFFERTTRKSLSIKIYNDGLLYEKKIPLVGILFL